jgi:hypothetical protein
VSGIKTDENPPGIERNCDEFWNMELSFMALDNPELRPELRLHMQRELVRRIFQMAESPDVREALEVNDLELARLKNPRECDHRRFLDTLSKVRAFIGEYLRQHDRS